MWAPGTAPVRPLSPEDQESLDFAARLMKILTRVPVTDAIGVALSYVLYCAYNHPDVLRRCLNEPVVREGFRGESLLTVISRVARS